MELLPNQDLNDLVQICIKVEQQLFRKGLKILHSYSSIRKDYKREGKQVVEEEPPKNLGKEKDKEKPREGTSLHTYTRDIKCFKCLRRDNISSQCLMSVYYFPHLMFNFGYFIGFLCLKGDLIENSDNLAYWVCETKIA